MTASVRTDPNLLDGLIRTCLEAILFAHPGQGPKEVRLPRFDREAYSQQRDHIPGRLNTLLKARMEAQSIRHVDPVAVGGYVLLRHGTYFVRCSSYNAEVEPITRPSSDMVLFEINPHRNVLVVGKPFEAVDAIEAALTRRAAKEETQRQAVLHQALATGSQRRQDVTRDLQRILQLIDAEVEASKDAYTQHKWRRIERVEITFKDVLAICSLLGVDLASLMARPPAAPEATP